MQRWSPQQTTTHWGGNKEPPTSSLYPNRFTSSLYTEEDGSLFSHYKPAWIIDPHTSIEHSILIYSIPLDWKPMRRLNIYIPCSRCSTHILNQSIFYMFAPSFLSFFFFYYWTPPPIVNETTAATMIWVFCKELLYSFLLFLCVCFFEGWCGYQSCCWMYNQQQRKEKKLCCFKCF